jgi:hypothetical protein
MGNFFKPCPSRAITKFEYLFPEYLNPKIEPSKPQTHNQNQKNAPHSNPCLQKNNIRYRLYAIAAKVIKTGGKVITRDLCINRDD